MKIIHILLGKANPQTMNGVNVVVDRYAGLMYEKDYDVEVWGLTYHPHTNLPSSKYPIRFFQQYHTWSCKLDNKLIERLKTIDTVSTVVHFHGGFIREFPRIVKIVKGLKYFVMPHGMYHDKAIAVRSYRKTLYFSLIESNFILHSRGLLLYHVDEVAPKIKEKLGNIALKIIPKGPDRTLLFPSNILGIKKQEPIVWGYCGRIDKEKNVEQIIKCFLKFSRQRPYEKHMLSIIGDGHDLPQIRKRYASEIDSGSIEIHGAILGDEKVHLLLKMHYFIHLSSWETVSLSCIDALQLGIPLLITPETLMADNVNRFNAGVSTTHDEQSVVAAMHKLFTADRAALFKGCKEITNRVYNNKGSCDKLIELYKKALA